MYRAFVDTNVLIRLLVKDDDIKRKACENLLEKAKKNEVVLYVLPIAILEIVWVLEKYYKLDRETIRDLVGAILNTPEFRCEIKDIFRMALKAYDEKNIKFADAVMGYWGLGKGLSIIYTYDEKDFKKIEGLEVKKP
ncbi:MAG: type II toxin-antitoxin system VapC family toxin [Nitrospira sp.]|nr:type II toxin-antitoxin system VapC family toxin [Nitrospira sp.]